MNQPLQSFQSLIDKDISTQAELLQKVKSKEITPDEFQKKLQEWSDTFRKELFEIMK